MAVVLLPDEKSRTVAWRDLSAQVGPVTTVDWTRRVFRSRAQVVRFLGPKARVPNVDFAERQLLLVAPGPRSSTGYSVEVLNVTEKEGRITVRLRERTPTLRDRVEARVTYPYRLLSLPVGEDVYVDWVGR